ncbi:MAG: hypothetical protein AAGI54_04030 [Planctomycetota bacterium]
MRFIGGRPRGKRGDRGEAVGLEIGSQGVDSGGQAEQVAPLSREPGDGGLQRGEPAVVIDDPARAVVCTGDRGARDGLMLEAVLHASRGAAHVARVGLVFGGEHPGGQGGRGLVVGVGLAGVVDAAGAGEAPPLHADAGREVASGAELDEGECHGLACLIWGT